jgi:hypothetical protein
LGASLKEKMKRKLQTPNPAHHSRRLHEVGGVRQRRTKAKDPILRGKWRGENAFTEH